MEDALAQIVEQWREQRPDLDASPMLVIGRIHRLAQVTDAALRPTFAAAGLGPVRRPRRSTSDGTAVRAYRRAAA